jgi:hypothetical protein
MNRLWPVALLLFAGCAPAVTPPPIPDAEMYRLGAWVSFETSTHDSGGGGGGGQSVKPGDPCSDCGGTGRYGDGTVEHPCERCRGTGKIQPDDPAVADTGTAALWARLEYPRAH